jgi:hypothetical protein
MRRTRVVPQCFRDASLNSGKPAEMGLVFDIVFRKAGCGDPKPPTSILFACTSRFIPMGRHIRDAPLVQNIVHRDFFLARLFK